MGGREHMDSTVVPTAQCGFDNKLYSSKLMKTTMLVRHYKCCEGITAVVTTLQVVLQEFVTLRVQMRCLINMLKYVRPITLPCQFYSIAGVHQKFAIPKMGCVT